MNKMDALHMWWADPEVEVIPAGNPEATIDWLSKQNPETWHQVVMNWNYDYGDKVLRWILSQHNCDKGTAARVFLVEGVGHWLWDALKTNNETSETEHVCEIVLKNWAKYESEDFKHNFDHFPEQLRELIERFGKSGRFKNLPLNEVIAYRGERDAVSEYDSEDGRIVVSLASWLDAKGLQVS